MRSAPSLPPLPNSLGIALVISSATPLLLLDKDLCVGAASRSFCSAFGLDPAQVVGADLSSLGDGEWAAPQLRSLFRATMAGHAAIDAYEMDLIRTGQPTLCLILNAQMLEIDGADQRRMALAVLDVTAIRKAPYGMETDRLRRRHRHADRRRSQEAGPWHRHRRRAVEAARRHRDRDGHRPGHAGGDHASGEGLGARAGLPGLGGQVWHRCPVERLQARVVCRGQISLADRPIGVRTHQQ